VNRAVGPREAWRAKGREETNLAGKSHALNTGIREARGKIIAFVDDDVHPASDWLEVIWREFSADPNLEVVSGRVELLNPADLPITIRRQSKRVVFQSLTDSFNVMVGCNAAVRRALFDRIGYFDVDLGPGSEFESAEDADFFFRAWRSGAKLVYEPSLFVFHDHGRRTQSAGVKVRRGYAVGRGAFYAKHLLKGDLLVLGALRREVEFVVCCPPITIRNVVLQRDLLPLQGRVTSLGFEGQTQYGPLRVHLNRGDDISVRPGLCHGDGRY
jgi:GT2 family glycosyltransferase